MSKAYLLLEDGTVLEGEGFGAGGTCVGELVFTTGVTGCAESLTDPSYSGQIICFTFPMLCLGAGADNVVSTQAAQEFCQEHSHDPIPPIFELVPHAYHDILNESDNYRNEPLLKALNFLFNGTTDLSYLAEQEEHEAEEEAPHSQPEPKSAPSDVPAGATVISEQEVDESELIGDAPRVPHN